MKIEDYKLGQKVSLYGRIEAIDIADIHNKENTTILSIKTVTGKISVNPKWEKVTTELNPPKLVVPQFVADLIEKYKKKGCRLSHALEHVFDDVELSLYIKQQEGDYTEIIAEAWLAYPNITVKKEKLYTVEILDKTLVKVINENGTYFYKMSNHFLDSKMQILKNLTESEIKQADERLWEWAKEVTE